MDAFDVIKVCFRRWWVLLPVILLALGSGLGLLQQQKPVYYGFGAFALVYTHGDALMPGGADPRNENPLSGNGAALLGEAMGADFSSATSQERYGGVGNKGTSPSQPDDDSFFHVGVPQGSSAYLVETWGPSPQGVRKVVDSVMAAAPKKASEIQDRAGAPPKSQYTTFITSPTQVVEMPPQSRLKLILAVSAVGLMAGAALSVIVDGLIGRRQRRRAAEPPGGFEDGVDVPDDAEAESGSVRTVARGAGFAQVADPRTTAEVGSSSVPQVRDERSSARSADIDDLEEPDGGDEDLAVSASVLDLEPGASRAH